MPDAYDRCAASILTRLSVNLQSRLRSIFYLGASAIVTMLLIDMTHSND